MHEDRIERVTESGCWLWTGAVTDKGYAVRRPRRRRLVLVHREMFEVYKGPIPKGLCVLHKCDVRCCINPDHLFVGTHGDNMRDMARKGRRRGGGRKLSPEDHAKMKELRDGGGKLIEISKQFNVTEAGACWAIKHSKTTT